MVFVTFKHFKCRQDKLVLVLDKLLQQLYIVGVSEVIPG